MSKKLLWLIAMLSVFSLIAAACGDDDDDDGGTDTAEETTGAEDTGEETDGEAAAAAGEGSIWVLLPDSATSDRWELYDRRFFKEGFEAEGLTEDQDFTIVNAEGSAETQISQAEQAIGEGASVIVVTSNDSGSGATIIDLAKDAGVAVVEYDRFNTEGSAGGDVYVSFDNVLVGATMADVATPVIDALDADPKRVVMLNGGPTDNNATLFRAGYNATVEEKVAAGEWELVADDAVPDWDNQTAQDLMDGILVAAENDVDAVFAANDGLGGAVIASLENAELDPLAIPVTGQDATPAGIQNVLLGKQTMSVYKPIAEEAAVAVAAAVALRAGEDLTTLASDFEEIGTTTAGPAKLIGIDAEGNPTDSPDDGVAYVALTPVGVTADNVAETVIADGFLTVEELCTDDVAETDFCQENA